MRTPSATALITGIGGQDGQLLLQRSVADRIYGVVGPETGDVQLAALAARPEVTILRADLSDTKQCESVVAEASPDVVYHLAAVSSVARSWELPVETSQVNGMASVALMAACLKLAEREKREVRFVNASSAEIFGAATQAPQDENTQLAPNSPYGAAKAFAHTMANVFRGRGLWVTNAVLYNHESPLRPETFVTRKITKGVAEIVTGRSDKLQLGNLDARRDWGWAPDYVDGLIRMASNDQAEDFVLATGESHSVGDFAAAAFAAAGVSDWDRYVEVSTGLFRPADAVDLVGDASKARRLLQWSTTKEFTAIVEAMVTADLESLGGTPQSASEQGRKA